MTSYADNVFLNCPFDSKYQPLFDAIVFAIFDCGYVARSAKEYDDASQVRIDKIGRIIGDSKFGIHDVSRTELDENGLPRFNMPLELGLFLGAKRYGSGRHDDKMCLVMDVEQYRYQKFISDIAGQDIQAHKNDERRAITVVRNWLHSASKRRSIPSGSIVFKRYEKYLKELPAICDELNLDANELTFNDYTNLVSTWLEENG